MVPFRLALEQIPQVSACHVVIGCRTYGNFDATNGTTGKIFGAEFVVRKTLAFVASIPGWQDHDNRDALFGKFIGFLKSVGRNINVKTFGGSLTYHFQVAMVCITDDRTGGVGFYYFIQIFGSRRQIPGLTVPPHLLSRQCTDVGTELIQAE